MSIMDLNLSRRKSSTGSAGGVNPPGEPGGATPISSHTGSGPGQSYELIKSTQVRGNVYCCSSCWVLDSDSDNIYTV